VTVWVEGDQRLDQSQKFRYVLCVQGSSAKLVEGVGLIQEQGKDSFRKICVSYSTFLYIPEIFGLIYNPVIRPLTLTPQG